MPMAIVSKKLTVVGTTYKHYLRLSATVELSKNGKPEAESEIKHGITQNAFRMTLTANASACRIRTYGFLALVLLIAFKCLHGLAPSI